MPQWPTIQWPIAKAGKWRQESTACSYNHRSLGIFLLQLVIPITTISLWSCISCLMSMVAVAAAAAASSSTYGINANSAGRVDTVASLAGLSNGYATTSHIPHYYQESLQHSSPLQLQHHSNAVSPSANSFAGLSFDNFDVNYANAATTASVTNDKNKNTNFEEDNDHQHSTAVEAVDIFNSGFIPTTLTAAGHHYTVASNTKQKSNNDNRFSDLNLQSFGSSSGNDNFEFTPVQHSLYTTDDKNSPAIFGGESPKYVVGGTSTTADIDTIDLNSLQQGYALTYGKANTLLQPQLEQLTAAVVPTQHEQQQYQYEYQTNQKDHKQHGFKNYFTPFQGSTEAAAATTNAAIQSDLLTYKQQQPRAAATQPHTFFPLNNYQYDNIAGQLSVFNRNNDKNHNQLHATNQQHQHKQFEKHKLQAYDSFADSTTTNNNHHYLPMTTAAVGGSPNEYGNKSFSKNNYRLWQNPSKHQHAHAAMPNYRQYAKSQQHQHSKPKKFNNIEEQLAAESELNLQRYKSKRSDGTTESITFPEQSLEQYQSLKDLQQQLNQQQQQFQDLQHQLIEHDQQLQIQSKQQHPVSLMTSQATASTLPAITQTVHHTPQSLQALAGIPLAKHTHVIRNVPVPLHQQIYVPHKEAVQIDVPDTKITTVKNPLPIQIPVPKTVAVPDLHEVTIPIERVKPFPVERPIPFLVEKRVPYRVEKQIAKPIYYPMPIKIPIIHTVVHKLRSHVHPHGHGHGSHLHPHLQHQSHQLSHLKPASYFTLAHSTPHSSGHNIRLSPRHSLNQDLGIGHFAGNLLK